MLHIGERAGSGIHRIISAWSAAGYENPIIEEHIGNIERTTLTLPLTQASKGTQEIFKGTQETAKDTQENIIKVPKKTIRKNGAIELGKTATAILNAIIVQPTVTREMLAEQLKISDATIKKHLKNFRDMGLIERVGPNKGGHWKVKK